MKTIILGIILGLVLGFGITQGSDFVKKRDQTIFANGQIQAIGSLIIQANKCEEIPLNVKAKNDKGEDVELSATIKQVDCE